MNAIDAIDRYVVTRESNVVRVDFRREPNPPAPRFPGAGGLRESCDNGTSQLLDAVATLAPGPKLKQCAP
jgi:hypothetical protein